jgi:gliding motility-associated-like protein
VTMTSPTVPYKTGSLNYYLTTIPDPMVSTSGLDGNYPLISGNASFTDILHNNHDSDVLDVVYDIGPWIKDNRPILDCPNGVHSYTTVHVAATLIPTGTPKTYVGDSTLTPNIRCWGENNGEINLGVRGGFGRYLDNYYYNWSTVDGSGLVTVAEDQTGLTAGTYNVTVTDINNCIGRDTITLLQPDKLKIKLDSIVKDPCQGANDGAIYVTIAGGTHPYWDYNWDRPPYHGDDEDIEGIGGGPYTFNVVDTNGCTADTSIEVEFGEEIGLSIDQSVKGSYGISCTGFNDGFLNILNGTGNGPWETWDYTWIYPNGDSIKPKVIDSLHIIAIDSLFAGTYHLEVRDAAGCEYFGQQDYELTQPDPIRFESVTTTLYGGLYNISCTDSSDASISLYVSEIGRTGRTYLYNWYNYPSGAVVNPSTSNQSDIPAGDYSVIITDEDYGCFLDTTFTLVEPDSIQPLPVLSDYNIYNIACTDGTNGYIALHTTGGLGPYSYNWISPTGGPISTPTQDSIFGLTIGDYDVTVTDVLNCVRNWSYSLDQPPPIQINENIRDYNTYNVSCWGTQDGEILALNASGGVSGYSYLWLRSGDPFWSDTTELPSGLPADIYTLEVRDLNNCLFDTTFELTSPVPLVVDSFESVEISCNSVNDGWARVIVSGGVGSMPYDYLWSDPINTTTDDVGNLAIGWYNVLITDANGCTVFDSVYIHEPLPITAQFSIISENWYHGEMISCASAADGAVWAQASGGRSPYIYDWIGTVTSNDTIYGLSAGTYQVRISDIAGCDTILTVTLTEPLALNAIGIIERNTSCYNLNDGRINLEPRGGVSPYTYRWSSESLPADLTTEDIDNLYAGDYILTLWDMNLCRMDTSFTITEPDELIAEIIVDTIPFCPDSYDGMIHVDVTGGTEPYDIWWISQNTNNPVLYGLGEGIYVVQVDDINNCGPVGDSVILVADANNCLEIPTAISPNGDGKNDIWEIHGIEYYPDAIIEIYSRWGDLVFRSDRGYNTKFDGIYRGRHLPVDSYHYIINLHNGRGKPIIGNITIIL